MVKQGKKFKKGFTIIEVVLVLAIAGLIFLMVFIALPALQRSQRNTQREDDLARFLTAVTDYQSNNNGRLPFTTGWTQTTLGTFVSRYIDNTCTGTNSGPMTCSGNQWRDPDGTVYQFEEKKPTLATGADVTVGLTGTTVDHKVYFVLGGNCGLLEGNASKGTGDRQVALFMILEGGAITCNDNQ